MFIFEFANIRHRFAMLELKLDNQGYTSTCQRHVPTCNLQNQYLTTAFYIDPF